MKKRKKLDPISEEFKNIEEAAEFWETHSLSDYEKYLKEVKSGIDTKKIRI